MADECLDEAGGWHDLLIQLVRERPCLYEKGDNDFMDGRTIKLNNWKQICRLKKEAGFSQLTSKKGRAAEIIQVDTSEFI